MIDRGYGGERVRMRNGEWGRKPTKSRPFFCRKDFACHKGIPALKLQFPQNVTHAMQVHCTVPFLHTAHCTEAQHAADLYGRGPTSSTYHTYEFLQHNEM